MLDLSTEVLLDCILVRSAMQCIWIFFAAPVNRVKLLSKLYCYWNDSYLLVMCFATHVHQIRGNACKAAFTVCATAAFLCFCKVFVQSVHSSFEDMAFNLFIE